MDFTLYWFMFPVSIVVATCAMLSGIGGAALFTPLFILVFPLLGPEYALETTMAAIAAALFTQTFGFLSGFIGYYRRKLIDYTLAWRIVRVAAPIGIIGALAASEVHDSVLLASYAILVASLAVVTWRNSVTHDSAKSTRTESVRRELTDSRGHTYEYFDPRLGPRSVALTATGAFLTGMVSVGIGEVTMPDGTTPAGHPNYTHHYGGNIDFSYFIREDARPFGQLAYRQICNDASSLRDWSCVDTDGSAGQFGECISDCGDGHIVDIPRTALFLAAMGESGLIRVFGVDTAVDDELDAELTRLHGEGVAGASAARDHMASADDHSSWVWHFNHIHMSFE